MNQICAELDAIREEGTWRDEHIITQISAGHTKEVLDFAVKGFGEVKKEMGLCVCSYFKFQF